MTRKVGHKRSSRKNVKRNYSFEGALANDSRYDKESVGMVLDHKHRYVEQGPSNSAKDMLRNMSIRDKKIKEKAERKAAAKLKGKSVTFTGYHREVKKSAESKVVIPKGLKARDVQEGGVVPGDLTYDYTQRDRERRQKKKDSLNKYANELRGKLTRKKGEKRAAHQERMRKEMTGIVVEEASKSKVRSERHYKYSKKKKALSALSKMTEKERTELGHEAWLQELKKEQKARSRRKPGTTPKTKKGFRVHQSKVNQLTDDEIAWQIELTEGAIENLQKTDNFDHLTDKVEFGEVALAPPKIPQAHLEKFRDAKEKSRRKAAIRAGITGAGKKDVTKEEIVDTSGLGPHAATIAGQATIDAIRAAKVSGQAPQAKLTTEMNALREDIISRYRSHKRNVRSGKFTQEEAEEEADMDSEVRAARKASLRAQLQNSELKFQQMNRDGAFNAVGTLGFHGTRTGEFGTRVNPGTQVQYKKKKSLKHLEKDRHRKPRSGAPQHPGAADRDRNSQRSAGKVRRSASTKGQKSVYNTQASFKYGRAAPVQGKKKKRNKGASFKDSLPSFVMN